ncbi:MAG: choice-of-anchor B family protein, partial [Flavobacteriales bacterium]
GDELDEQSYGNNTKTIIFDFTDLDNPVYHFDYYGATTAIDHNGYVKDNIYYQANYTAGVRMIDVSGVENKNFTEVGFFDTYPNNNTAAFNGAWNVYPYFPSGNIIISDINNGFFIVRKSSTLGLSTEKTEMNFSIFPNPSTTQTTISTSNNKTIKSIKVFSILGKKLLDVKNIYKSKYIIETKNFQRGIYLVQINNMLVKKIMVQ